MGNLWQLLEYTFFVSFLQPHERRAASFTAYGPTVELLTLVAQLENASPFLSSVAL